MRLNQVTVSVTDIEKSIAFYRTLGFQLIVHSPHYARFIVPENEATFSIHLADVVASSTTIYFECDALAATAQQLQAAGLEFAQLPTMQSWLWEEAYLHDPDGNVICLYFAGENRLNPPWRLTQ
jgi:catechol 2,3-dioxygenase-like lactoylglutathione lyase family enzyme